MPAMRLQVATAQAREINAVLFLGRRASRRAAELGWDGASLPRPHPEPEPAVGPRLRAGPGTEVGSGVRFDPGIEVEPGIRVEPGTPAERYRGGLRYRGRPRRRVVSGIDVRAPWPVEAPVPTWPRPC